MSTTRVDADWRWKAVSERDAAADGQFVYAVASTGVFCRPSCPSRRPRRDRVEFFDTAGAAAAAGYRPCKRCRPTTNAPIAAGDDAVRRAAAYLDAHADQHVSLATLARVSGMSAFHLQRRFTQALGMSPREYLAARRARRFRDELRAGRDITAAIYEAGYGSPSRVYESSPTGPGMSPAAYRRGGEGVSIGFTTVESPFGWILIAATEKGVCAVKLGDSPRALEADLRREYPKADVQRDRFVHPEWAERIILLNASKPGRSSLPLDVQGTAFQWRVWRALQQIPPGETRTYSDIARAIGQPHAVRAVARACASNPAGLVIPCHRVVPKGGGTGGYRWGTTRKALLLQKEKEAK